MVNEDFKDKTIELAKTSVSRRKVGAILSNKNNIVSSATNLEAKSHPIQAEWAKKAGKPKCIFLHAEIHALIQAKEDADSIYVARVSKHDEIRMAKPCEICELALRSAGVKNVYYTNNDGWHTMTL